MRVLVIDNYDSFTYNLVQYLGELGAEAEVVRNDKATVAELLGRRPGNLNPCRWLARRGKRGAGSGRDQRGRRSGTNESVDGQKRFHAGHLTADIESQSHCLQDRQPRDFVAQRRSRCRRFVIQCAGSGGAPPHGNCESCRVDRSRWSGTWGEAEKDPSYLIRVVPA